VGFKLLSSRLKKNSCKRAMENWSNQLAKKSSIAGSANLAISNGPRPLSGVKGRNPLLTCHCSTFVQMGFFTPGPAAFGLLTARWFFTWPPPEYATEIVFAALENSEEGRRGRINSAKKCISQNKQKNTRKIKNQSQLAINLHRMNVRHTRRMSDK